MHEAVLKMHHSPNVDSAAGACHRSGSAAVSSRRALLDNAGSTGHKCEQIPPTNYSRREITMEYKKDDLIDMLATGKMSRRKFQSLLGPSASRR